jgi:metal-sulfur cluster biosynthetic enzyme
MAMQLTEAVVRAAITSVVDPCSRYNGSQLNLVELGMVDSIRISDGTIGIRLLLDDPMCMYTFLIQKEIRDAVGSLPGVDAVVIEVLADQIWSEQRMSDAARDRLAIHRDERRHQLIQLRTLIDTDSPSPASRSSRQIGGK